MPQTEITLKNIVYRQPLCCGMATPAAEAARRMAEMQCSSILVEDRGKIVGIWTEQDALAMDLSAPGAYRLPISRLMSSPVMTIGIDVGIGEAALRFRREKVRHFLVMDEAGKPKGIVSQSDVVINQGIEYFIALRDVKSVYSPKLLILPESLPVLQAVRDMREDGFEAVVVDGAKRGYGILTERDVLRLIASERPPGAVGELAHFPLVCIPQSASLYHARQRFHEMGFRHLGVNGDDGTLLGLISFADLLANIEREYIRELENALKQRDERLAATGKDLRLAGKVFETTGEAIMVTDARPSIESVNPAFSEITGYAANEVVGKNPSILSSGMHDAAYYASMYRQLAAAGHWRGEIWNRRKNGEIYVERITINAVADDTGEVSNYVAVFSDVTRQKAAEEQMRFLAQHDPLTRLPNRTLLEDRLHRAISHAERNEKKLAVVFLDLVDFKQVNDTLGHHAGDRLLQIVAQRLTDCVRAEDTVARLGGDEFVLLLEEIGDEDSALLIVGKILDALARPVALDGREVSVGGSIGVSTYPDDGLEVQELIGHADAAMYRAKLQEGNAYCIHGSPPVAHVPRARS